MWSAFVTGFAEEASKMIDERNKEISERALAEMESLLKKKVEADEAALTKRNEYREQAKALRSLSGNRLTESQVVGILQSGQATTVIDNLKKRTVGTDKLAKLFVPANADDQKTIESYIEEATKLTGAAPPQIEERTAFGLKTRAGESIRQRAAAAAGVPLEELYKTKMADTSADIGGTLDLSVFADPETTDKLKVKMRDIIANTQKTDGGITFATPEDEKQFDLLRKQIEAAAVVKGMFAFEEKKPRTTSEIRSIFRDSLREGLDPYIISGVAQVMPNGDVEPIVGSDIDIAAYRSSRNSIIREIAINRGLIDPRTNEVINEQAEDALTPFAVIEDGKIVNWKTSAPGSTAKTGGGGSAGAKPAGVPSPATPPDPTVVQYINKDGEPKTKKFATKEDADEFYRKWSAGGGKFWRRSGNELIVN
jgi:hypothetical protein